MRIKISSGAERDMEDGCDFYGEIDPNLATYFHDSISADIDPLLLYAGVHAKSDGWYYTSASRFPFVIWYGIMEDIVVVYAGGGVSDWWCGEGARQRASLRGPFSFVDFSMLNKPSNISLVSMYLYLLEEFNHLGL